ncbi:COLL6-like protein [Mya arenaria]|uniref:COLL6-like protein n=1 Tax=Mya arenaria TaxID=6604 RepID=A0ABY7DIA4_MYAAR|nr:COLL6-like protein [Mya arenaria]
MDGSPTLLRCRSAPTPLEKDIMPNFKCFESPTLVDTLIYSAALELRQTCLSSNSSEFVNKVCSNLKSWNVCGLKNTMSDSDDFLEGFEASFESNIMNIDSKINPEEMKVFNLVDVETHCKNNIEHCRFYLAIDKTLRMEYQAAVESEGYSQMDAYFHNLKHFIAFPTDAELHILGEDTRHCKDDKSSSNKAVGNACSVLAAVSVKNQMDYASPVETKDILSYLHNTSIQQPQVPCEELKEYEEIVTVNECNEVCNKNEEKTTAYICKLAAFGLQYTRANDGQDRHKTIEDDVPNQKTVVSSNANTDHTDKGDTANGDKTDKDDTANGDKTDKDDTANGEKTDKDDTANTDKTDKDDTTNGDKTDKSDTANGDKTDKDDTAKTDKDDTTNGDKTDKNNTVNADKTDKDDTTNGDKTDKNNTVNADKTDKGDTANGDKTDKDDTANGDKTDKDDTANGDKTDKDDTANGDKTDKGKGNTTITDKTDQGDTSIISDKTGKGDTSITDKTDKGTTIKTDETDKVDKNQGNFATSSTFGPISSSTTPVTQVEEAENKISVDTDDTSKTDAEASKDSEGSGSDDKPKLNV